MPTRIVRGEFNESRSMNEVSVLAELTFVKLILACDDFGRLDGRASVLKARLFPAREISAGKVLAAVAELAAEGCVRLYEVDGSPYLELVNWEKHRGKGRRAPVSKYPDPEARDATESIRGNPRKSEETHADPPEGYRGIGTRGIGTRGKVVRSSEPPSASVCASPAKTKIPIPPLEQWPASVCENICSKRRVPPAHLKHAIDRVANWHEDGASRAARVKRTEPRWHIYLRDQDWPYEGFTGNGADRPDPTGNRAAAQAVMQGVLDRAAAREKTSVSDPQPARLPGPHG